VIIVWENKVKKLQSGLSQRIDLLIFKNKTSKRLFLQTKHLFKILTNNFSVSEDEDMVNKK